ncbi:MAG TPA: TOBE domain-containing protein, partial [Glaciibacter sp.]|nr:TOBE domain-containing protein [Glaciibacter sp.]
SEIYDRPVSPFVAGFVGSSNILDDRMSRALLGRGGTHSVRPEKIIVSRRGQAPATERFADGTLAGVVYLGNATRLIVDLDAGGRMIVLEQNDSHRVPEAERGSLVTLGWRERDTVTLDHAVTSEQANATH